MEFDYKNNGFGVRDFFPFFDYDNVLDVTEINKIYPYETPFLQGLKNAFERFLSVRKNIVFKPDVTKNEEKIIALIGNK